MSFGQQLPRIVTPPPGPASRALAARLTRVESRNITRVDENVAPIFWAAARGANVRDEDGNIYVDLTGGFAVAAAGHANLQVAGAIAAQAAALPHALGDVHPSTRKVELLERIAALTPPGLDVAILGSAGAEAVEAALKTALLATGRPGVIAFRNAYHGLTYGALATTWRADFRAPFTRQLYGGVRFARFPDPYHAQETDPVAAVIAEVRGQVLDAAAGKHPVGAVLVEPVQGRGGIVVPPPSFLPALRALCDELELVLILDEIYTGIGRTGRWFACEHAGVTPDILVLGKALAGSLPISAAVGTRAVRDAWPPSRGEAIHTSTFLGNPVSCAAALAQLREIEERGLVQRAAELGAHVEAALRRWHEELPIVGHVRGLGLLQGAELVSDRQTRSPATEAAGLVIERALARGVLLLAEGAAGNVLAITPPLAIEAAQLEHALQVVEQELRRVTSP
jgi:4-aminobutyrate aminotransferase / (S)-3-amino-2-methylpropionate transaminase / 5-aminovalerate transaminase